MSEVVSYHVISVEEHRRLEAERDEMRELLREALQMLEIYYQPNIGEDGKPLTDEKDRAPTMYRIRCALGLSSDPP